MGSKIVLDTQITAQVPIRHVNPWKWLLSFNISYIISAIFMGSKTMLVTQLAAQVPFTLWTH